MKARNRTPTRTQTATPQDSVTLDTLKPLFGDNSRVQTIQFLAENSDTVFLQHEIADQVGVSEAMISRVCADLESYGLIERCDADSNEKYTGVTLADTELASLLANLIVEADRARND